MLINCKTPIQLKGLGVAFVSLQYRAEPQQPKRRSQGNAEGRTVETQNKELRQPWVQSYGNTDSEHV